MYELNLQQQDAVYEEESVFVTACPGSGKTRVLTAKVIHAVAQIASAKHRVVAVTFTNRAADEITARLHESGLSGKQAWTGSIHGFALEWILRPYCCYIPELERGFSVADDFYTRRAIDALRDEYGIGRFDEVDTGFTRDGDSLATPGPECDLVERYRGDLREKRLVDFDMILHLAFQLLRDRPEIPKTLASMIKLVCIDEYQDTQELQYGILSEIVKASSGTTRVFIVGDEDQAIYSSLGSVAKALPDIQAEFGLSTLKHYMLSGNYRSTQRIIDFCSNFQDTTSEIHSRADYALERGEIVFSNQEIDKSILAERVAGVVARYLDDGVPAHEICVLAPQWQLVTSMGRQLISHLPDVDLDAPGLSPFRTQKDSVWFKLARLFLTDPHPNRYRTRLRWAADFIQSFELELGRELDESIRSPRNFLRLCNAIHSDEEEGIPYLESVIGSLLKAIDVHLGLSENLQESYESFFDGAKSRLEKSDYASALTVDSLKKMFRHPSGVVINTCHGVKGEEYTTVICFGVLRGYIPNWKRIIDDDADDREDARRLLYVVSSRARKHLHFFAENGRQTQRRNPYTTTEELEEVDFAYDIYLP